MRSRLRFSAQIQCRAQIQSVACPYPVNAMQLRESNMGQCRRALQPTNHSADKAPPTQMHQSAEHCRRRCRTRTACTRVQSSVLLAPHVGFRAGDRAQLCVEACPTCRAPTCPVLPACTVTSLCTRTARCDGDADGVSSPARSKGRRGVWACRGPSTGFACQGVQHPARHDNAHQCTRKDSDCGGSVCRHHGSAWPPCGVQHIDQHRPAAFMVCRPHFAVLAQPLKRPYYPNRWPDAQLLTT